MFEALAKDTLSTQVTEQVENLILHRHLQPGDRLPAERELALQFKVSRTVIREAVRALTAKGMLHVKHGSGTIVRTPSAANITQTMTLLLRGNREDLDYRKVMEVRRLLEVEIAGLAASRRTEEHLALLEKILNDREGTREERERFVEWDVGFHSALAHCTGNELFGLVLDSVAGVMKKVREMGFDVASTPDRAYGHHAAIYEQVRLGLPDGARQAMREHLDEAEQTMREAMELRAKVKKVRK